jgi:hypothetical protein
MLRGVEYSTKFGIVNKQYCLFRFWLELLLIHKFPLNSSYRKKKKKKKTTKKNPRSGQYISI